MASQALSTASWHGSLQRRFYLIAAASMIALMLIGFSAFYLRGLESGDRPIPPQIYALVIVHGVVLTSWMLVLLLQPLLIAARWHSLHKTLGWWLFGLAAMVPVSGTLVAILSVGINPHRQVYGLNYPQFLLVMLVEMLVFAGLVTAAVLQHKKPQAHRALMLLSGLGIISGATARMGLNGLFGHEGWFSFFGPVLVLGVLFVLVRWLLSGKLDRWLAGGFAVTQAIYLVSWELATSAGWDRILGLVFGL